MNKTILSLKTQINEMEKEMAELEPARAKFYEISFKKGKLVDELRRLEKRTRLDKIELITRYKECSYPSMGVAGENGSAYFVNEEDFDELLAALCSNSSYYYTYKGEYAGPGEYEVVPDWDTDHDGDTIYTAVIKKL